MAGLAKLSDFGLSEIRVHKLVGYRTGLPLLVRWKALECLDTDPSAFDSPILEANVYALGMCIIEAVTGDVPWRVLAVSDDDDELIIDSLLEVVGHPRPEGLFSDDQWALVSEISRVDVDERMDLTVAIEKLRELAEQQDEQDGEDSRWVFVSSESEERAQVRE